MGFIFKHLDDLEIIRSLLPKDTKVEYGDDDMYGDEEKQAGKVIHIEEGAYDLVPVHGKYETNSIGGKKSHDTILWDVWTYDYNPGVSYYPDGSGEPPSTDERELGTDKTLQEAIKLILDDMFRINLDAVMENGYAENQYKEEQLNPDEAYPHCMTSK